MTAITLGGRPVALPSVKPRALVKTTIATVVLIVLVSYVLPTFVNAAGSKSGHWETPFPFVLLGLIQGMIYGLLSVGIVLIYRSNRIINFAHGQIGAFGSALFGLLVVQGHVPYYLALIPALGITALVSATAEAVVIRRLRKAPPLMSIVATLGVGTVLLAFVAVFNNQSNAGSIFPQPDLPSFTVGALQVTPSYFGMLVFSPIIVIGIGLFLKFSRFGLAIRASAANPEAARMAGIFSSRMSGLAWALAGAVAAFGAILVAPSQGFQTSDSFGPSLLLRALVGAVIARMASLPLAMAGGVVLGIVESLLVYNFKKPGTVDVAIFLIVLVAMLVQRQRVGRADEKGSWAAVQGSRPLPAALREIWVIRNMGTLVGVATLGVFCLLPTLIDNKDCSSITGILGFIVVGISVSIVTGLGGQLSLGQFGIAAVGAVVSYQVSRRTGNYFESFAYAGLACAALSVLIGLPALRIKGLLLTVTTLAFALLVPSYLLIQPWAAGAGVKPGSPIVNGYAVVTGKAYLYVALATLTVAVLLARNIRKGGVGRLLIAVRDNEDAARAFSVSATKVKIQGFALAGFIAGLGGAMYGHSLPLLTQNSFIVANNVNIVVMCVVGGIGLLYGPMLGSIVVFFIPQFLPLHSFGLFATSLGQLLIIMYLPGGLGQLVTPLRDRLARAIGRAHGLDVDAIFLKESSSGAADAPKAPLREAPSFTDDPLPGEVEPAATVVVPASAQVNERIVRPALVGPGEYLLEAVELRKSFGGVRAVRGVSFGVRTGETLGLIGPNGAGKTTTFELLAGFTAVDEGSVRFGGKDISYLSPEARAQRGLIRSFQDAALFPTLSVTECVMLSLERVAPTGVLPAVAGITRAEKRKEQTARELVSWMGLDRYRSAQIQELSTGTRRITEIACLVALEPRLLLLDEPASGVAQKETEALGELLVRLREQLDLTLVVIEHDIPLIMSISNRIVAMADGEVIAAGSPEAVRNAPAVVEAYLGGSITAIERSGAGTGAAPPQVPSRRQFAGEPAEGLSGHAATEAGGAHLHVPDGHHLEAPAAIAHQLAEVCGISLTRAQLLAAHFGSLEALRAASEAELCAVPGIGPGSARRLRAGLLQEVS